MSGSRATTVAAMEELDGGIHVTGTGTAGAAPDVMVVDAGVEVTAADPGAAFERAKEALAGLRQAVLALGVAEKDLQTSQVTLYPTHDRDGNPNGHQAGLGLVITVRDISGSGAVIDAVTAGAGEYARLNGIRLDHSEPQALVSLARRRAVADAQSKAAELAGLVGRSVGKCVRVADGASPAPRMMAARAMPEMAVDAGEVEQTVTVATVWQFAD